MNSVMNGKIRERTPFETLYVQPAAADNGTALGAAFYVWNHVLGRPRGFVMDHGYWGPVFTDQQIRVALDTQQPELARLGCEILEIEDEEELCRRTAGGASRGSDRRVVSGADGVGGAGAR